MSKVVQLRGQRPGGWAKERWVWIGAVMADGSLTMAARLVAVSLAQGFANHETAECRPGLAALMRAVSASRATVVRAMSDLHAKGWIERRGGNAPGKLATYAFRNPSHPREQCSSVTPEQCSSVVPTVLNPEKSPCTPYKDKPHMNQKAHPNPRAALRPQPMPPCMTTIVEPGSLAAERWNEWLAAEGFPPLERIGHKVEGGWRMPVTVAPTKGEAIPHGIARRWAGWLRSKA
jgi:hypothetical protein